MSYSNPSLRTQYEQVFQTRDLDPIEGFWESRNQYFESVSLVYRTNPSGNGGFPFAARALRIEQKVRLPIRLPDPSQVLARWKPTENPKVYHGQALMAKGSQQFWQDASLSIIDPTTIEITYHIDGPVYGGRTQRGYFVGPEETLEARLKQIADNKRDATEVSSGSGFLVARELVVTAYHVVRNSETIRCFVGDESFPARLVSHDKQNDLALLLLETAPRAEFRVFKIAPASNVKQGEQVFSLGYPLPDVLGTKMRVHEGIVSSVVGFRGTASQFQVEMALNPGDSGGPVVDSRGGVVGVVMSKLGLGYALETGRLPEAVTFAVKSDLLWMLAASVQDSEGLTTADSTGPVLTLEEIVESLGGAVVRIESD